TATHCPTSRECSRPVPSMFSRPTRLDAWKLPGFSKSGRSARQGVCRCRPIAHLRYIYIRVARYRASATWNISTITTGLSTCFSTGDLTPVDGVLWPDLSRPGLGLEFKRRDAARFTLKVEEVQQ